MMYVREKLEGNEMWEIYGSSENTESRYADVLEDVQNWIFSNLDSLSVKFIAEDDVRLATISDLERAVNMAGTDDLERFMKSRKKCLNYEDGFLHVVVKRRKNTDEP